MAPPGCDPRASVVFPRACLTAMASFMRRIYSVRPACSVLAQAAGHAQLPVLNRGGAALDILSVVLGSAKPISLGTGTYVTRK